MSRLQSVSSPLRHHDFRLLFSRQLVSHRGDWLDFLAQGILIAYIWRLGPAALAALAIVIAVPWFVIAPFAGVLVAVTGSGGALGAVAVGRFAGGVNPFALLGRGSAVIGGLVAVMQLGTPAALMGRVSSSVATLPTICQLAAPIAGAALARWQSVGFVFAAAGGGLAVEGIIVMLFHPAVGAQRQQEGAA
jgi:hypothetical protein